MLTEAVEASVEISLSDPNEARQTKTPDPAGISTPTELVGLVPVSKYLREAFSTEPTAMSAPAGGANAVATVDTVNDADPRGLEDESVPGHV
jgi:hypothetical protein